MALVFWIGLTDVGDVKLSLAAGGIQERNHLN
jgi:hypothetical protein